MNVIVITLFVVLFLLGGIIGLIIGATAANS